MSDKTAQGNSSDGSGPTGLLNVLPAYDEPIPSRLLDRCSRCIIGRSLDEETPDARLSDR